MQTVKRWDETKHAGQNTKIGKTWDWIFLGGEHETKTHETKTKRYS